MREYITVLQAHEAGLSSRLHATYTYPGVRGETVYAARHETMMLGHARERRTATITCGLQICCDRTGILVERVECLDNRVSCGKQVRKERSWLPTQSHAGAEHDGAETWAIAEPKQSTKVASEAKIDI
jgi:hypothetical protein